MRFGSKRGPMGVTLGWRLSAIATVAAASMPAWAHGEEIVLLFLALVLVQIGCLAVVVWLARTRKALTGLVYFLAAGALWIVFSDIPLSRGRIAWVITAFVLLSIAAAIAVHASVGRRSTSEIGTSS